MKGLLETSWFTKVTLVLWLVSVFFVLFLLGRIDYVINHDLYGFGLQFSFVWADPYWAVLRLIYVCLAVPSVFSAVALGLDFWGRIHDVKRVSGGVGKPAGGKVQSLKGNSMLISCPSCRRTFGKPLVMLDFSSGKAKLVSVCPYCNAKLGDGGKREVERDVEVGVLGQDEQVKTEQ